MNDEVRPADVLGSERFPEWYPGQQDLLMDMVDWYYAGSRFLGVSVPTGAGKSILALMLARHTGARTVILTATKGLQDQYARDILFLDGRIVKGRNNFPCQVRPEVTAEHGPCRVGLSCAPNRETAEAIRATCQYNVQLQQGLASNLIVTNYAYWLAQTNYSTGLGDVDLLICDEAHQAFGAMEGYLTLMLSVDDIRSVGCEFPDTMPDEWGTWRTWATTMAEIAKENADKATREVVSSLKRGALVPAGSLRRARWQAGIAARIASLADIKEPWVVERVPAGYQFTPKWVALYTERLFKLEKEIPKVMMMSAILSRRSAGYLGVMGSDVLDWLEAPSYFPPENSPIWHVPTMRLDYRVRPEDMTPWVSRIDQLIEHRPDRKGLVLTVSYERAKLLLSRSRFRDIMMSHYRGNVTEVVERFREATPPAVLVSPSVTTGFDFPMQDQAQYIIIGKIPYPDTSGAVMKARREDDRDWASYLAMEALVQSCGRMTRSANDLCEVICIDDSFRWFYPKYLTFAPSWFRARYNDRLSRAGTVASCAV